MPTSAVLTDTCLQSRFGGWVRDLVVIVGDSHAQQWGGAVLPIAQEHGWDIVALLKGGCAFAEDEPPLTNADDCHEWREAALDFIENLKPSLVFGMATRSVPESPDEYALSGLERTVARIADTGASVVLFRDNPRFDQDMFVCVEDWGPDAPDCRRSRAAVLGPENPAGDVAGADVVDLSDFLCPDGWCLPVIGNVAVYLDHNHLTHAYARTLAPVLAARLTTLGVLG